MREKYVALVIGNREYATAQRVENAALDATEISELFERIHHKHVSFHLELKANDFDNAVSDFQEISRGPSSA